MKCENCDSVTINGVYCHERGCPTRTKELRELKQEEQESKGEEQCK